MASALWRRDDDCATAERGVNEAEATHYSQDGSRLAAAPAHVVAVDVPMVRLIKRYTNRKMYDTQTSKYVTLDGVADLVRRGEDLRIIDNDTGEDLTAVILAQVIVEEQKRQNPLIGLPVLRWIIQQGGATLQEILSGVDRGREALEELAQKGMKQFTQNADGKAAERPAGRGFLNEILELPQKQLEQLQHRIDAQVRASIERVTEHPAVKHELKRIETNIKSLEDQLQRLRGRRGKANRRRGRVTAAPRSKRDT